MAEANKPGASNGAPAPREERSAEVPTAKGRDPLGKTVTVACKHPRGLYLQLWKMEGSREAAGSNGMFRETRRAVPHGQRHRVFGTAVPPGKSPKVQIVDGFALTPGIPAEVWEEWKRQNHDRDDLRAGLITAYPEFDSAVDYARDHAALKSGLEPMDPEKLPKGMGIATFKADDDRLAA